MRKHTAWTTAAALLALALGAGMASAISDADACDAQGGVYENDNGTKTCTITTTPGKNQGGVTKLEEDGQKGSFSSSHPTEEEDCTKNHGGTHC